MSEHKPHFVWAFVAIIAISVYVYIQASNRPDVENIGKGGLKEESHDTYWPFSINIGQGSCAHMGAKNGKITPLTNTVK